MNILFICDEYPPGKTGGIGTSVQLLARELVNQGHKVIVAGLYSYSFGGDPHFYDQGVEVWRLRYGPDLGLHDNIGYKLYRKLPAPIKAALNGKKAFDRFVVFIKKVIIEKAIDIIEIADWNTFSVEIGFPVRWPNFSVPLVLKSHGSYTKIYTELGLKMSDNHRATDHALFNRADAHAAVSVNTAEINRKLFAIKQDVKVLYNGILIPSPAEQPREQHLVVYSGALTASKGVHKLIRAWETVARSMPDARLLLYGKGNIASFASRLGPSSSRSVMFMGHVSREALFESLKKASVAVYPSFSETFGLAVLEAMANGCAVIFTKYGSGPEIVSHKIDGMLVDPSQEAEIAAAIEFLFNNPELAEQMGERARKKVSEKFNITTVVHDHLHFYREVVSRFKAERAVV